MPRRVKSLAYDAGEHLARQINEGIISNHEASAVWRKAAKFLADEPYRDFVDGYNSLMTELDRRTHVR